MPSRAPGSEFHRFPRGKPSLWGRRCKLLLLPMQRTRCGAGCNPFCDQPSPTKRGRTWSRRSPPRAARQAARSRSQGAGGPEWWWTVSGQVGPGPTPCAPPPQRQSAAKWLSLIPPLFTPFFSLSLQDRQITSPCSLGSAPAPVISCRKVAMEKILKSKPDRALIKMMEKLRRTFQNLPT